MGKSDSCQNIQIKLIIIKIVLQNGKPVETGALKHRFFSIRHFDVIVSCITEAQSLLCEDNTLYKEGCLVVPDIHVVFKIVTFFFDKVYADDTAHVCGFKYFNRFKQYGEIQDVISGKIIGRESNEERILSYNIGLGLHDIVYASKIYEILKDNSNEIAIERETVKFWI